MTKNKETTCSTSLSTSPFPEVTGAHNLQINSESNLPLQIEPAETHPADSILPDTGPS
ncbi:MAG: hypothetical protein U5K99_05080 [Anaerolineales bacterium]|nr:hypothetical protein [Anaerolineales bacterium]